MRPSARSNVAHNGAALRCASRLSRWTSIITVLTSYTINTPAKIKAEATTRRWCHRLAPHRTRTCPSKSPSPPYNSACSPFLTALAPRNTRLQHRDSDVDKHSLRPCRGADHEQKGILSGQTSCLWKEGHQLLPSQPLHTRDGLSQRALRTRSRAPAH